jgi:hypothetical protein
VALSEDQKAMLRLLAQREQGYEDIAALSGSSVEDVRARVKGAIAGLDGTLSGDQKAILRLLAQREEGYDDLAALSGSSVEAVRARVKDALAGLDGESAGRKPAAPERAPVPPPSPPERPPSPPSEPPRPPAARRPAATLAAKKVAPAGLKLPEDRGVRRALAAGAAVVLLIVVLLVTGVLGEGGPSDSTATTTGGESAPTGGEETGTPTANGGKAATEAILKPVDGGNGEGQALFGRAGQKVIVLFGAKGLQQAPKGETYTVSLVRSASERLPLIATSATKSGIISGRFEVAPQVLGLLAAGFDTMELSIVPNDELRTALAEARTAKKAPSYGGTPVLEGPVTGPIVEAGEAEEEEEEEEEEG